MIIRVKISTNDCRKSDTFENTTTTVRQAFEQLDVRMGTNVTLNAESLHPAQFDTPIAELTGATEVLLASVVKADSAC